MGANVLVASILTLMVLGVWVLTRGDPWLRYLRAVAHQVGGVEADLEARRLVGVVDGVSVHVAPSDDRGDAYEVRFAADELEGVSIVARPVDEGAFGGGCTGDAGFDEEVQIAGLSDAVVVATLGRSARWRLRQAVQAGWRLEEGGWRASQQLRRYPVPELFSAVEEGVALCAALRREGSVEEGLVRRALEDPDLGVRRRAVDLLVEGGVGPAVVQRLLDGGAAVAMHLVGALPRPEQIQRLRDLVDHADPDTAWCATQQLAAEGVDARVRRGWVRGLDHEATRRMAVERLAEAGEVSDVAPLRAVAGRWPRGHDALRADEAIQAIQARAVGAEAGALAVARPSAGEVAVAHRMANDTGQTGHGG